MNIILILNSLNNIVSSDKRVSLFNLLFQIRPDSQPASLHFYGIRPPCRLHRQSINIPGGVKGLKCAHGAWVIEAKTSATTLTLLKPPTQFGQPVISSVVNSSRRPGSQLELTN